MIGRQDLTKALAVAVAATALLASAASADSHLPGKGQTVVIGQDNIDSENFQTILVIKALERLGYTVAEVQNAKYPALHLAVASGDVTLMADHWTPLHKAFYEKAGGDAKLSIHGVLIENCAQGYLIDKKTADAHGITNMEQLKDPAIAKLFDNNDDGTADLTGCPPGWGCERVIEHHLGAYDLRPSVTHNQGEYSALIANTITQYRQGESVLYYTWTPYWVSGVLVPGKDVIWMEVPFSSLPDNRTADTELPNGKNYGFEVNQQNIMANKAWADANPAAVKLFELMTIPSNDVSAENLQLQKVEGDTWEASTRHAEAWIKKNQAAFDGWIEAALKAAK